MAKSSKQVAIVADSSISLPQPMLEEWGIEVAPLEIRFGELVYLDGVDLDVATFYRLLKTANPLPTTSAPQPASFLDAFRKASKRAPHVVCLTIAARFSAAHQSALLAAKLAKETLPTVGITVLDTGVAAGAEALVALAAARGARRGDGLEKVLARCHAVMGRVNLLAFMNTLHYLWKGGRIPRVAAWTGDALQVKPLLEMTQNDVHLVARPRTKQRATERLLSILAERTKGRPIVVNIIHAADSEGAAELYREVSQRFPCQEAFISEFSPALGVHTGPGLLGLAFYVTEDTSFQAAKEVED